jgi:hypothetical protein
MSQPDSQSVKTNTDFLTEPSLEGHRGNREPSWLRRFLDLLFPPVDNDPYANLAAQRSFHERVISSRAERKRRAEQVSPVETHEQEAASS